jgi:hypothetical protein
MTERFMVRRLCAYALVARTDVFRHILTNFWPEVVSLNELNRFTNPWVADELMVVMLSE